MNEMERKYMENYEEKQYDLIDHINRQRKFSITTFGPENRTKGIINHIKKELKEIEETPDDIEEWIDVAMLAFDGAWRTGKTSFEIAEAFRLKLEKNMKRDWPDWRSSDPEKAIEHIR